MQPRLRHRDSDHDHDPNAGDLTQIWAANPQAERSQSSFSSAVRRNDTTPSKRRRGSDGLTRRSRTDHDPWSTETSSGTHSRSRTVDDEVGAGESFWFSRSRSTTQHPLRSSSSLASSSSWTLDHDTRPSLKRILSDSDALDLASNGNRHEREGSRVPDREMLVIVHEVQPKDSLAGVALKYGITLADLRRANQLWTSDSIHLRKVLHIPVDKTRQARQLREALIDSSLAQEPPSPTPDPSIVSDSEEETPPVEDTLLDIGKLTIRRVPASQLSYFPPSTQSLSLLDNDHSSTARNSSTLPNGKGSRNRSALPLSFKRPGDSPLQGVLAVVSSSLHTTTEHLRASTTSLFGNPIPRVPTTLAARLSLESTSGTPSSVSDDFDWEHEMEDVSAGMTARRANGTTTSPPNSLTRTRSHARQASASLNDLHASPKSVREQEQEERDSVELDVGPFQASGGSPPSPRTPTHRHHRRASSGRSDSAREKATTKHTHKQKPAVPYAGDASAAVEWGSPRAASVVRTAQMEPSPGMQLPLMARRTKSMDPFA
ncbi:hypothetical protein GSI_09427 [Ganoderma sinense ZZ0214-1]|uniref:LysM domain-containing protein n=1 Tax=Ganoderma sinense ZZ0214-1 TaxID=1077348 RepID=A0A2G8S6K0_9APHY|nr:hypothetical protein GSI_09427 [Ganoderma sinense ZZ0214-1]